jgi:chorismate-pyruvate lyase
VVQWHQDFADWISASRGLATEALEDWYQQSITVELRLRSNATLREAPPYPAAARMLAELLAASEVAVVQHRHVRMTVAEGMVGLACSTVLLDRITPAERDVLTGTNGALGRSLQARGVCRRGLSVASRTEDDAAGDSREVVRLQTLLCRDDRPLAYTEEEFYSRAVDLDSGWPYPGVTRAIAHATKLPVTTASSRRRVRNLS